MEIWGVILVATLAAVPFIVWQRSPRFPQETNELRDSNFLKIYKGQDLTAGSREANDERRAELVSRAVDMEAPHCVVFYASPINHPDRTSIAKLAKILECGRSQGVSKNKQTGQLQFTEQWLLKSMSFDRRTMALNDFLFEHGWEYDGWKLAPEGKSEE